ncbi:uncharacterized protein [Physcomitrium patens]|uniref:DUF7781 domain-containing protein n=1 Tax=Physcomitrium patens TaxID=3218 RepID=A0A2K1JJB6_PHYPA|nr:uncharacterized protein LOC112291686 isoform X2 [Physcomitrium patens]PNR41638.1 hypothetical protein PHYPA_019043 [Physcomitrium patens]|eukprot:XP_024395244.1 uncharacterized protein LOC112291686 isoform X2 [Physcomitrella patens]
MENGRLARREGHDSSSSRPQGSASSIGDDPRGFRATCKDLHHTLREFYNIEVMPKTFIIKFRQRVQGVQLGANFEFDGMQVDRMKLNNFSPDDCHTKLVLKPSSETAYWKVICEPKEKDLRILTKKIPLGSLFNFQFGIGHDFFRNSTGWKWKVTSAFGLPGVPEVCQKTKVPIFPGLDVNVDWNTQYEFPELQGSSGTGEPSVKANFGRLHVDIERLAVVYTHNS